MKVFRFVAETNQKAMNLVQEKFGSDALIHSIKSTLEGIEILATPPGEMVNEPVNILSQLMNKDDYFKEQEKQYQLIHTLNEQIQSLQQHLNGLSKHFRLLMPNPDLRLHDEQLFHQKNTRYYLNQLGIQGSFVDFFIDKYVGTHLLRDSNNEGKINHLLKNHFEIEKDEIANKTGIFALVGPTGVGKTTTIAKIAKRFLRTHSAEKLGLITTDLEDQHVKNQLLHYSNLFDVDIEAVESARELIAAIDRMDQKDLILIDTHGVSQRDQHRLKNLINFVESQGELINVYLTMPCNIQQSIMNEIVMAFSLKNLRGCIFTKQDECIHLSPVMNCCLNFNLKIAYFCDGQDILKDIHIPTKNSLLQDLHTDLLPNNVSMMRDSHFALSN